MTMNFILKTYGDLVIDPLKKECRRLELKIRSNNIFDLMLRPVYKEDLKLFQQLLFEQYVYSRTFGHGFPHYPAKVSYDIRPRFPTTSGHGFSQHPASRIAS